MVTHRKHFFAVIIPQQLLALAGFAHLVYTQQWWWLALTYICWFLMYVVGEGIFLHRYFSHKSFECHPLWPRVFSVFALMGGFGAPIGYRAVHTGMHHAHSDKPGDAHSPTKGLWYAIGGWHLDNHKLPLMICKSLLAQKYYVFLEQNVIRIWWGVFLLTAALDWRVALYSIAIPGFFCFWFAAITNAACHSVGTRRFDTDDNSRNLAFLSPIMLQGSSVLQNNHHAFPDRFHDSHVWYEVDIGKWLIPVIATKVRPIRDV